MSPTSSRTSSGPGTKCSAAASWCRGANRSTSDPQGAIARCCNGRGRLARMPESDPKADLQRYLQVAREALVWKLDGLTEYDIRRPMTPTGTNLLGLVKHNAISDSRYFGDVFDRPFPEPLPRWEDPAADFVDHSATEHETRDEIVHLYRRV